MSQESQALQLTLDVAVQSATDGVVVFDRNREVTFFSEACERMTGIKNGAALGSTSALDQQLQCTDVHGQKLDGLLCSGAEILGGELAQFRQRMSIQHADGRRVWVETTFSPIRIDNGDVSGVVAIMRDITDAMQRDGGRDVAADRGSPHALGGQVSDADVESSEALAFGKRMGPLDNKLSSLERREILAALAETHGQRTLAAHRLGISRSRLYRRMEALGIDPRQVASHEDY